MQLHTGRLPNGAIFQVLHYEAEILQNFKEIHG